MTPTQTLADRLIAMYDFNVEITGSGPGTEMLCVRSERIPNQYVLISAYDGEAMFEDVVAGVPSIVIWSYVDAPDNDALDGDAIDEILTVKCNTPVDLAMHLVMTAMQIWIWNNATTRSYV